ncbi:hypothetical protein E2562_017825 [Oryza meyeriana var. granulata]|uniref:RNase H type-1 domain-containing protein n=1 Tax=Oryza meyeriana var. granulata TaxID=110450 RepID=A0A6G1DY14_9ORYZ|nr:hypothetical protein E2562_017825 [Oryza meyeriana var. granulata]
MAHTDGAWGAARVRAAAIITSPTGKAAAFAARQEFRTTNNIVEYEAILLALWKARAMGVPHIIIRMDSQVAARQIDKSLQACHLELTKYLAAFQKAEANFKGISVRSMPRSEIANANALAKAAINNEPLPAHVLYEVLHGSAPHRPP